MDMVDVCLEVSGHFRFCDGGGNNNKRFYALAKLPGDVIFGLFLFGAGEQVQRGARFNDFAFVKESGAIAAARCLLHVVSDNHDGVLFAQLVNQVFDFGRRARVKR